MHVFLTDIDKVALERLEASVELNELEGKCTVENFHLGKMFHGDVDWIIASDVIYSRDLCSKLINTVVTTLQECGSRLLLGFESAVAEPTFVSDIDFVNFRDHLVKKGFTVKMVAKEHRISVWLFEKESEHEL